jgi:hypothetical protein
VIGAEQKAHEATQQTQRIAGRAADNPALELLARVGLVAYGVLHLSLAWIALKIASGHRAQHADQQGALATVARQPLGPYVLIAVIGGFLAFAAWQVTEAVRGHNDESSAKMRGAKRIVSAGRVVLFIALALTAWQLLQGRAKPATQKQASATRDLLTMSGGPIIVGLIGVFVLAIGGFLIHRGITKGFRENLAVGSMPRSTRRTAEFLGSLGYAAKGIALGVAGILVVSAAVTFNPNKSRGLDAALRTLGAEPFGKVLLTLIALGLACFGIYSFVDARYRKI